MKPLKCLLGFHDFYAMYPPLILLIKKSQIGEYAEETAPYQYVTIKRMCIHCKHREEYLIKISGDLRDWDVVTTPLEVKK